MKDSLFIEMMAGFAEATKHRRKQNARVRVSRISQDVAALRPKEIRKIRTALGLSQTDFARYLGTSVVRVRSWEQGIRRPQSATLRLLNIAKKNPRPSSNLLPDPDAAHLDRGVATRPPG